MANIELAKCGVINLLGGRPVRASTAVQADRNPVLLNLREGFPQRSDASTRFYRRFQGGV